MLVILQWRILGGMPTLIALPQERLRPLPLVLWFHGFGVDTEVHRAEMERAEDPFSYSLNIGTGSAGETRPAKVDLVETFNYLLGLRVKHIDRIRGSRVVRGTSPEGERVLVIWRNTREVSNADLDTFFRKLDSNPRDAEFDVIYVNGDNNLENLRRKDETWKVRLTEEEFLRRMFDVREV